MCLVELTLRPRVADEVGLKAKRDPFLDVIGSCTGGDGRLAENIDEALYGQEVFPTEDGLASTKQAPMGAETLKKSEQPQRKTARKRRKLRGPKSR